MIENVEKALDETGEGQSFIGAWPLYFGTMSPYAQWTSGTVFYRMNTAEKEIDHFLALILV